MRDLVKKIIPANSGVFKFLSKRYRSLFKLWLPKSGQADAILKKYAAAQPNVFFVQVGSNDGISNDPIHDYVVHNDWKGILVEPVKYLFEKLRSNYHNNSNQLIFENKAIAQNDGTASFYRLKETGDPNTPFWYSQVGSFNKQVLLSHKDRDDFESLVIEEQISTVSFSSLLAKHNINKVDLVHIDTEGYDFEILKLIDFKKLGTVIVLYEYVHLSLTDFIKSLRLMRSNGFEVFASGLDIVCVKKTLAI